jgi:hypothetical protein
MRFKLLVLSFVVCTACSTLVEVPIFAEKCWAEPNGIFLGRGIFSCSKNIILEVGYPSKKAASLNKQDKNFEKALKWLDVNMYMQILSPKTLSNERPEGWLRLHAIELPTDDQTKVLPSILIEVPLTNETLGLDCHKKIEQLKQIMIGGTD